MIEDKNSATKKYIKIYMENKAIVALQKTTNYVARENIKESLVKVIDIDQSTILVTTALSSSWHQNNIIIFILVENSY